MEDALEYIETHQEKVEAEYRTVLEYTDEIRQYWEERNRKRLDKIATMPPKPGQEEIRDRLKARKIKIGV